MKNFLSSEAKQTSSVLMARSDYITLIAVNKMARLFIHSVNTSSPTKTHYVQHN